MGYMTHDESVLFLVLVVLTVFLQVTPVISYLIYQNVKERKKCLRNRSGRPSSLRLVK